VRALRYAWVLPLAISCARGSASRAHPSHGTPAAGSGLAGRHTIFPVAAHHQHLVGPTMLAAWHRAPMRSTPLPRELDDVLRGHQALMGAGAAADSLKDVYAPDARVLHPERIVEGSAAIARWWSAYKAKDAVRYVLPTSYRLGDDRGYIAGVMIQHHPDSTTRYARRLLSILMYVEKGGDGKWRIVAESGTPMSDAPNVDTLTAASLVKHMDEAGVAHGIVAALGYHFTKGTETPGERPLVEAENDWTVRQVGQFPGRLVVFCGLNPIRSYAVAEMDRCGKLPQVRGMKLYLGDRVDLANPEHIEKVRHFFRAANERRMPLLVHLSIDGSNGALHARNFLEQVVPVAPDIPIQIAHLASGGTYRLGAPDQALKVFADAAAAGNPLMKNLYFDVTGSVYGSQPAATYDTLASRMRTIGLERVLFGSDLPFYPQEKVAGAWAKFREFTPLTDDELRVVAGNVAPYAR